jgi:hypothetical protein
MPFQLPGAQHRTAVVGGTGTGKTVFGAWLLSKQSMETRPWIALDYKMEELWDRVGDPPMRPLALGAMPGKKGLYRAHIRPGQEEETEDWLWKIWERGNIGLFCDEVTLLPQKAAFKAILRQGRSKLIPVIACTQRPVDVDREVFTESQYKAVFALDDVRDYKTVQGFAHGFDVGKALPPFHCHWVDMRQREHFILKPAPGPDSVAKSLRSKAPYSWFFGG